MLGVGRGSGTWEFTARAGRGLRVFGTTWRRPRASPQVLPESSSPCPCLAEKCSCARPGLWVRGPAVTVEVVCGFLGFVPSSCGGVLVFGLGDLVPLWRLLPVVPCHGCGSRT